ncbi:Hypothetical_protein [Hexamita inflata]|uniref:Hypothetical_protein n=1 Tax=Hexamita inflata TaxID=28002 RepID=A0AA86N441_9EUKA|nr:Hypothetical protein HINF_LOCUS6 [Hexamita inflata]CAI9912367.1 Hypothetical protein HINF_LOCUS12 [Hexamita inflata]
MQQFAPSHYSLLIEFRNIKSIEIDKFFDELPKEGFKQQESQSRNKNVSAISAATNTSHAPHLPQLQALVINPDSRKSTDNGRFSSKITCRSNGYNGIAQSVQISSSEASKILFGMFVCYEVYCCPNCQGKFNQNYFGKQSQYLQNSVFESALLQFYQNGILDGILLKWKFKYQCSLIGNSKQLNICGVTISQIFTPLVQA